MLGYELSIYEIISFDVFNFPEKRGMMKIMKKTKKKKDKKSKKRNQKKKERKREKNEIKEKRPKKEEKKAIWNSFLLVVERPFL